jgi:AP-1 complex subunit mu
LGRLGRRPQASVGAARRARACREACRLTFSPASSLPVLALSKRNSNAAEIIIFLHRLASVLTEYFKELEEESIRDNFVIVYELLDEMMDFGFPQTTESKILQECVLAGVTAVRAST